MAKPLQIIVTTPHNRFAFNDVLEILVKPHDGGMELRQNALGWDLKPREMEGKDNDENEEKVPLEQKSVYGEPDSVFSDERCGRWDWLRILHVGMRGHVKEE